MFRFTALVTLSATASEHDASDHFASGTHKLMVQVWRDGHPPHERHFPAELAWSQERELTPGDHALMTISIADPEARSDLRAGGHSGCGAPVRAMESCAVRYSPASCPASSPC